MIPAPTRARRLARALATAGFVCLLAVMATMTALGGGSPRPHFVHRYPPDPISFDRPKVSGAAARASKHDTVARPVRIHSLNELARNLAGGTLRRLGSGHWRLEAPVDVTRDAVVEISGGQLDLAPGSLLQARAGGSITLSDMSITAVDAAGRPEASAVDDRGYLVARDGGRLVLRHDRLVDLGHLGIVSYGVSFRAPAPGSAVLDSTISGNYFGVFLSQATGVAIVGNRVIGSHVYGIDPYGGSTDILIKGNYVAGSGLHGIVLADYVSRVRVLDNRVVATKAHGIVLYSHADRNVVAGNQIEGAFDGIVLTASSANTISRNRVDRVVRFGLRVSGGSSENRLRENTFTHALLGAYFYGGASGNSLDASRFAGNRENVRVRTDAPANRVTPTPPLSELR